MFGQGNGAGRPKRQPYTMNTDFNYGMEGLSWNRNPDRQTPNKPYNPLSGWTPPNTRPYGPMNVSNWDTIGNSNTNISAMPSASQTINAIDYITPSIPQVETSWLDNVNSFLGPIGGLTGGLTGLLGAGSMLGGLLGYNKLDLGRERNELGKVSGNFQARGDEAWKFGQELRSGTGKFYDTAKNEIGRQADTLLASMRTSSAGAPSAAAYRRNMGDMRRQMYEQMSSAMNQMYATGLQQSAQYGGLASDLWRNRIGAEQAIAQMLEAENKSANEPYGQLMNMGGSILGGLLGGVLG